MGKTGIAHALIARRYRRRIVPALVKECKYHRLSWTLAGMQMVDFRLGFRAGLRELLRIWSIALRRAYQ